MSASCLFVSHATWAQLRNYQTVLTNQRGDQLWRFIDGPDRKPRWKVWAEDRSHRREIAMLKHAVLGASYYLGGTFLGSDFIIPKQYVRLVSRKLGLLLEKQIPTEKQRLQHLRFSQVKRGPHGGSGKDPTTEI